MEGLRTDIDEVSEIITDLRLHKNQSSFCNKDYEILVEVCGHSAMYDYVFETDINITAYGLLKLNQLLYQYSPHPENAGKFRQVNNLVVESKFETSEYSEISRQISDLDREVRFLVNNQSTMSITEFISYCARIHHRITVIHPFTDGNGRVSRAFLNWLFRLRGLPPIYIKVEKKNLYYDALAKADLTGEYDALCEVFCREILRSLYELNSKFLVEDSDFDIS